MANETGVKSTELATATTSVLNSAIVALITHTGKDENYSVNVKV